jgi:hypothetical protein
MTHRFEFFPLELPVIESSNMFRPILFVFIPIIFRLARRGCAVAFYNAWRGRSLAPRCPRGSRCPAGRSWILTLSFKWLQGKRRSEGRYKCAVRPWYMIEDAERPVCGWRLLYNRSIFFCVFPCLGERILGRRHIRYVLEYAVGVVRIAFLSRDGLMFHVR